MTDVMSSKPWSCKHDQCRSWVRLTVRYVIRYVTCVLHKTFFLDFNLHTARVANTPQHEEGKREESSPQEVSEGGQVGYWITVRVFTPPPKSVDHTVGYTQQGEDLEGKTISFFCLCNSTEEAHFVFFSRYCKAVMNHGEEKWPHVLVTHLDQWRGQEGDSQQRTGQSVASFDQVNGV